MKLANVLPESGRNLACLLTPVSGFTISNFELEQWRGQTYVKTRFNQQTGLYRLSPHEANPRLLPQTLFFDAATDRWYSGPWYDLRYLAQRTAGVPCRVQYHAGLQRLAIPANYRWPDLYERALVLASGLLPLRSLDNGWYCFSDIPPELAQTLAHKLDATVEETA